MKRALFATVLFLLYCGPPPNPEVPFTGQEVRPLRIYYGKASFYGVPFGGKKTASGETFDPEALTAAHPSWPFGTICRVIHRKKGRSVVVRINDRGPKRPDRIIDLSLAAARALEGLREGVFDVKIEVLRWGRPNAP